MALIKCHECGNRVSSEAAACPKCGAQPKQPEPRPARKEVEFTSRHKLVAAGLGVVLAGWIISNMAGDKNGSPDSGASAANASSCRQDLQCWGGNSMGFAKNHCRDPIEREAKHTVRWGDDMTHPMFTKLGWHDEAAGVVTFIGDRAEFENGLGGFARFTYACDFDPNGYKVVGVRVFEGRLN